MPDSAVIDAGDRKIVFLDRGDGRLEPREVTLGVKHGGRRTRSCAASPTGDRVVTSANFLARLGVEPQGRARVRMGAPASGEHRH